jgi:hypothetical protein
MRLRFNRIGHADSKWELSKHCSAIPKNSLLLPIMIEARSCNLK